jgi:hypothetical protein
MLTERSITTLGLLLSIQKRGGRSLKQCCSLSANIYSSYSDRRGEEKTRSQEYETSQVLRKISLFVLAVIPLLVFKKEYLHP